MPPSKGEEKSLLWRAGEFGRCLWSTKAIRCLFDPWSQNFSLVPFFFFFCSRIPQAHLLFCKIYFVSSLGGCPGRHQLLQTDNRNLWYLRDIVLCRVLQRGVESISRPRVSLKCWFWECSLGTLVFLTMQVTMRGQHASLALCICVCACVCVRTRAHMHTHVQTWALMFTHEASRMKTVKLWHPCSWLRDMV